MNYASPLFQKAIEFNRDANVDKTKTIFHIDVNSAYLSWMAAYKLSKGDPIDLRTIPSVVGGDELSRHGIVLAKSMPAKIYGIKTGNPLRTALTQCPNLTIVPPDYGIFSRASQAFFDLLCQYSPKVQRFSVDECFVDFTDTTPHGREPLALAREISDRIHIELGFTVNIGISTNKLLAKMASDFKKPKGIHTLFPDEIAEKMWPLPVSELFMAGRKTTEKLHRNNIMTIGDLAHASPSYLETTFKKFGIMLYLYANGIDHAPMRKSNFEIVKGLGNSTTVPFDVTTRADAYKVLLSLCEMVGVRLRRHNSMAQLISLSLVTNEFYGRSHQRMLELPTNSTNYLHQISKELFDEMWDKSPVRKLGIRASKLQSGDFYQTSLLQTYDVQKEATIDQLVDTLRSKYGTNIIQRASFINSGIKPVTGGIGEENYPVMTCNL